MAKAKEVTVKSEVRRLRRILETLPKEKIAVAEGLIVQAARLRVQLDELYRDLEENGRTEMFQQSEKCEPYERERPSAAMFVKLDKNYQSVMRTLAEMAPVKVEQSRLLEMMRE
jgi:hypothetical protein